MEEGSFHQLLQKPAGTEVTGALSVDPSRISSMKLEHTTRWGSCSQLAMGPGLLGGDD